MKMNSLGNIHLRFPVAGQWSLSVEFEGEVYTSLIEVHGQRGKLAKLYSSSAADAARTQDKIEPTDSSTENKGNQLPAVTPSKEVD